MIGLKYNLPYINMDEYIDTDSFLNLSSHICEGISKSEYHICDPGSRTEGIEGYPDLLHPHEAEKYIEAKGNNIFQKRMYLKYMHKVIYPVQGIYIRKQNNYHNKHLTKECNNTNNAKHFSKLLDYIYTLPFVEVGRVFIFLQEHFAPLTKHRDSMDEDYNNNVTDFLWFTIDKNAMRFYIEGDKKHYINSTCAWFNENDLHGSDGVPEATFCLRIDGVFDAEFKNRIITKHYSE